MSGRPPFMPPGPWGPHGMPPPPFMPPGMPMMGPPGFGPRGPPGYPGPPPSAMPPTGGRIMGPSAGLIAGVKRAAASGGPVEKSTTVSVGKIAPTIDNKTIQALLEACGPVKSWKRAEDPETKQPKGFGFAEYEDAEGVLRAVRLLNGFKVDGQELVIKGNSATQRYVEEYEAKKKAEREQKLDAAKKKSEEGEVTDDKALTEALANEEQTADNKALEAIMSIVSDREEAAAKKSGPSSSSAAAASEFLAAVARGDLKLPGPPGNEDGSEGPGPTDRGRDRSRERSRDRDGDRDRDRERDKEREYDREKERERDLERERRRAEEREYESRVRDWERAERQRQELRERERQRRDQAERDRLRQCRMDMEKGDEDDDLAPWARRPYKGSRRWSERRWKRHAEEEADALDRQKEERDLEEAAERKRRRLEAGLDEDEEDGLSEAPGARSANRQRTTSASQQHAHKEELSEVKPEVSEASAAPRTMSPEVDETDPIYKAMMAAATSAPAAARVKQEAAVSLPRPGDRALHHATHDPHAALKSEHRNVLKEETAEPSYYATASSGAAPTTRHHQPPPAAARPSTGMRGAFGRAGPATGVKSIFGDEEDEGASRRVLKPIQYSEEEKRVAEDIDRERQQAAAAAQAATAQTPATTPTDPKAALRALMDAIPTTKEGVFSYSIKWGHLTELVMERFKKWVDSKVAQLLGAPEPTVVQFILGQVSQRKTAPDMAQELEPLLDSETESFVIKMFRTIIFETERTAAGL